MADDKAVPVPSEAKGPKEWRYVGPGSESRPKERVPLISNLPLDFKQPRLGFDQNKYPANELPAKFVEYVMRTNTTARDWWK